MIRKLADGRFRLYSRKKNPRTGKRRNLGTFANRRAPRSVRHAERVLPAIEDQRHDQILLVVEMPHQSL